MRGCGGSKVVVAVAFLTLAGGVAMDVVGPTAAFAGGARQCAERATSQPFAEWGDVNSYFPMPAGSFDQGAPGWYLRGASQIVPENAPWSFDGTGTPASLQLATGGSARARGFCTGPDENSIRFLVSSPGVAESSLTVRITARADGREATSTTVISGGTEGWDVSPIVIIPDARGEDGRQTVSVKFYAAGASGTWQVDDVMVDPWRAK
jgi:hypothetical protein